MLKMAVLAALAFVAMSCKQAPKYDLTDGEWVMNAWIDDNGEEMMITQNRPTMKFESESIVYGSAGCNNFNGRYTVNGEQIEINLGAMTMKMCMDTTVENRMVTRMPNVTRFEIEGNQLKLFNKDGQELFRFNNAVNKEEAVAE